MADYDVQPLALVTPPAQAVRTSYRPAVSVRNNGIHDALASGYLRIYAAGLLVFETEVYSGTIAPGETGLAQGVDYWTPADEGEHIVYGYVTCPLDQVESNNELHPTIIFVSGVTPPPEPTVPLHASQHEEGGRDEVNIDGLKGLAADEQRPRAHASNHQAGGTDQLNVGSLEGVLAQDQPAQVHSNTKHNPAMATAAQLASHEGAAYVHGSATNLANRATSGRMSGLVPDNQLADQAEIAEEGQVLAREALLLAAEGEEPLTGRRYGFPWPHDHAAMHQADGRDPMYGLLPFWIVCVWDSRNDLPPGWEESPGAIPGLQPPWITITFASPP
jgi:hypothetical protein